VAIVCNKISAARHGQGVFRKTSAEPQNEAQGNAKADRGCYVKFPASSAELIDAFV